MKTKEEIIERLRADAQSFLALEDEQRQAATEYLARGDVCGVEDAMHWIVVNRAKLEQTETLLQWATGTDKE